MRRDPIMKITDQDMVGIIEKEISQSIGHWDGSLASARDQELKYYLGEPFGNEMEGESQVISTDVADTIEGILPIILKIFTASDDVVHFDPNGPEDEEQAKQQTEVANYVFYRQNNGFLVLYQWFKDALMMKNGIVKYWWEDKQEQTKESYKGLTDAEYRGLMKKDGYIEIKELSHEAYEDPIAAQQIASVRERATQMLQIPQAAQQAAQMLQQLDAAPMPQLHDVTVRIVKDVSKLCIQAIPPEEFGISARHNCVSIQDTGFCYHRSKQTISSLREAGCPESILAELPTNYEGRDVTPEALRRDRYLDNQWADMKAADDSQSEVWVTEGFIRIDKDGDGIAELRHFIMPHRTMWIDEEAEHINFAALTPIIMPHRWVGRSVSELVMDIQFNKSVLWRQMFNNLYLTNNPQKVVLSSAGGIMQANVDDLLSSRPGGLLREYVPNAIRNQETPFVAGASFPMLEYMDGVKENRTGVTRYNQGTDADSLNKTARGIGMIQAAGQERTNLIARIFAETGVKDLMRGIVYMLSKYNSKPMTVKLRNKWVDVDPREWETQYNMTVNVGLGTGNKDIQIAHLGRIREQQMAMMKEGRAYMVTDENIYNVAKLEAEAMGYKHPEMFFADPEKVDPKAKEKPPSPDIIKIQSDAQESQAKLAFEREKEPFRAQSDQAIAQIQQQGAIAIAQINAATQKEIAAMKIQADGQLAVYQTQNKLDGEKNQLALGNHQLSTAVQTETMALEKKQSEIAFEAQLLALQKQVLQMQEQHRTELAARDEQAVEAKETKSAAAVQTTTKQLATLIASLAQSTKESLAVQKETLAFMKAPKRMALSDVSIGPDGIVTGGTVAPQTVQ